LFASGLADTPEVAGVVEVGIHHEQQHQELLLTDVKHLLSCHPLQPAYRAAAATSLQEDASASGDAEVLRDTEASGDAATPASQSALRWHAYPEGLRRIGYDGDDFAYDNERPRHRVFLESFELASRLVTNGEYLEFIRDRGYETPELWLSDGWDTVQRLGWRAPLYWEHVDGAWFHFTLNGPQPVRPEDPVTHVSYFEAEAFARWAGARLPTEAEWEVAAAAQAVAGNFVESGRLRPAPAPSQSPAGLEDAPRQMYGDVWEWTRSQYSPYPGYAAPEGALGEYNGKFMCNQFVLRGGSCATSRTHIRAAYRNFFPPEKRWQFSGLRLARDAR
jgi:ergothioneine biosynthesis protein EgtB